MSKQAQHWEKTRGLLMMTLAIWFVFSIGPDGVRNYQAAKNLKSMKKGDQCFFYHSNIGKEIVGTVQVTKEHYIDKTDKSGRFVAVTVKFLKKLDKPVTLEDIKKNKELSHLSLIKQSRLSVMPIDSKSWKILNKMSKI